MNAPYPVGPTGPGQPIAGLYRVWNRCFDGCWDYDFGGIKPDHQCYQTLPFTVTKTTAKRIYFRDDRGRNYFIAREAFRTDERGDVVAFHRGLLELLYLNEPTWHIRVHKTLADLRRDMADAHPDRGGTRETFQAARRRYTTARAAAAGWSA